MRKMGRSEIIMWKCPTCGSRNKIYTILVDGAGNRIGSSLTCCNCGTLLKRLDNIAAKNKDERSDSFPGRQYCIKLHNNCENCKNCPLNKSSVTPDPSDKDNPCCDCSTCPYRNCCKKQNSGKLTINVNKVRKFID